jgi:uncharacterized protein (TIGR01619 family)
MTENWKSYFCNVNSKLASIALNLSLNEGAPIQTKPWLLWVWVYLQHPRPDGLSDQGEFETISAIEDALLKGLASTCQAIEAGRITTDGHREFYFYGSSANGFEAAIRAAMRNFSAYKFDVGKQHEPEWDQYRNVLYPSKESMERIKNMDVLEVLEKHGDTLESVRDVHHWIYFKTSNDRRLFAEDVLQLGYTVEGQLEALENEFPYSIQITRDQSVTPAKIDDAVLELFRMAKELDGEYDGWETQVIAKRN